VFPKFARKGSPAGYSHADVRNMLRVVGKQHELERQPLALLLRHAFGMTTCQEAVMHLLEMAFSGGAERTALLRDIIFTCDVHGAGTGAAAEKFNLSRRQFFRYRAEAFDALAATIARSLNAPPDDSVYLWTIAHQISMTAPEQALALLDVSDIDPYGQLGHFRVTLQVWAGQPVTEDDLARCSDHFRLRAMLRIAGEVHGRGEYARAEAMIDDVRTSAAAMGSAAFDDLHYDIADVRRWPARRRGDIDALASCVDAMRRHAGTEWSITRLHHGDAEVACHRGDIASAETSVAQSWRMSMAVRDAILLSSSALAEARLAYLRGAYKRAFKFAFAAAIGLLGHRSYALMAQVIAGKSALAAGMAWEPPRDWVKRYPDAWQRAELDVIRARRLLAAGAAEHAEGVAREALADGERHQSPVAIANALDALSAALEHRGDVAEARTARLRARDICAKCGDAVLRRDLSMPSASDDTASETRRGPDAAGHVSLTVAPEFGV